MSVRNLRVSPSGTTADVDSHSKSGLTYKVVRSEDGNYRCTCPQSFIKGLQCKHIDEVIDATFEHFADQPSSLYRVSYRIIGTHEHRAAAVVARTVAEAESRLRSWQPKAVYVIKPTIKLADGITNLY